MGKELVLSLIKLLEEWVLDSLSARGRVTLVTSARALTILSMK